jgi:hypothetical protein
MRALACLVLAFVLSAACSSGDSRATADSVKPLLVDQAAAPAAGSDSLTPGYGRPHPGSWDPTSEYADSLFTIRYPSSAKVEKKPPQDGAQEVWVSELPECRWPCYVTVRIRHDTSAALLNTAVREETTPATSGNPDAADDVASIRDSLPLGNVRAVHLETYCGDCTSGALLTAHGPWLVRIEYNLDDRDGYNQPLLSHLIATARTFRWRDEGSERRPANDR